MTKTFTLPQAFHINDLYLSDKNTIKICPLCYKEDIETLGEPYLHRIHNVIGVKTCYKHDCYLDVINYSFHNTEPLFDIETDYKPSEVRYPIEQHIKLHKRINEDVAFVLSGGLNLLSKDDLNEKIKTKLLFMNIFAPYNSNRHPLLVNFLEEYGHDFLKEYESDFNLSDKVIWLRSILYIPEKVINPFQQLIGLGYIFGSLNSLMSINEAFKPFGDAPYPCLNHICPHYHKDVIVDVKDTLDDYKTAIIRTFSCGYCGFTYTKRSNALNVADRYAYTLLKDRGQLWRDKLTELILENKYSSNKLGEIMKADKRDILKHAGSNGLLHYFNVKTDKSYKGREPVYTVDIEDYKKQLLEFINDNPGLTRNEIKKAMNKVWGTLYNRDKEWLYSNLPEQFDKSKMKRKEFDDEYWLQKESELISRFEPIIADVLSKNEKVRITKNLLMVRSNSHGSLTDKYLKMMPKLQMFLDEKIETLESYYARIGQKRRVNKPIEK